MMILPTIFCPTQTSSAYISRDLHEKRGGEQGSGPAKDIARNPGRKQAGARKGDKDQGRKGARKGGSCLVLTPDFHQPTQLFIAGVVWVPPEWMIPQ